jgi:hypothetical protein
MIGGMWWRSWLRHYATSWKAASLIPDEVIEFLQSEVTGLSLYKVIEFLQFT